MSDSTDDEARGQVGFGALIAQASQRPAGFDWQDDDVGAEAAQVLAVLRFGVGARQYAVAARYVREIVSDLRITPVPGAPNYVRGVAIYRRQVLGVLSLDQWLDPVAARAVAEQGRIVIVEAGAYLVGIDANEVSGMGEWAEETLDRSRIPDTLSARTRRYAAGIRVEGNQATVLLDIPRLLADAAVQ